MINSKVLLVQEEEKIRMLNSRIFLKIIENWQLSLTTTVSLCFWNVNYLNKTEKHTVSDPFVFDRFSLYENKFKALTNS